MLREIRIKLAISVLNLSCNNCINVTLFLRYDLILCCHNGFCRRSLRNENSWQKIP